MQRFQIEDILAQDHHGVVFAAVDGETGQQVALRRFFPFGPDGGGLQPEERSAYVIGVQRLAEVSHPSLRAVVAGGCDPVDGMPFLVTEWVEGSTLANLLQQGSLTRESAIALMWQALEVCELLSQLLAEDDVWVETSPSAIVLGEGESERGVTFWISPFRWLSAEEARPGLMPLVELLDASMGWQHKPVSDKSEGGLGAWRNWLKANAQKATLADARAALTAFTEGGLVAAMPSPGPVGKVPAPRAAPAHRPMVVTRHKTSWGGVVVISLLVLTALGMGGWLYYKQHHPDESVAAADEAKIGAQPETDGQPPKKGALTEDLVEEKPVEKPAAAEHVVEKPLDEASRVAAANARAAELSSQQAKELQQRADQAKAAEAKGGVFEAKDLELVALQKGKAVKVEGVLLGVGESNSKKTGYLRFTTDLDPKFVEGKFDKPTKDPGLQDAALKALIGKRIRISGTVEVTALNKVRRVQVDFPNRAAIEVLP